MFGGSGNAGGYGIGDWLRSSLGFPMQPQRSNVYDSIRAREQATEMEMDREIAADPNPRNPWPTNPAAGRPPLMSGGVAGGSAVPQPQADPLDRFERLARMMDLGERVGGAFDKGPMQTISSGGGVAPPQLPQANQYGLSILR